MESLVPRELLDVGAPEFLERVEECDVAWRSRMEAVRERGAVLRYRAKATPTAVSVGLVEVAESDSLGSLQGTDNQFSFRTERYRDNPLVIRGPGAGPAVTAAGVFNDLLRLASERGSEPSSRARLGRRTQPARGAAVTV